MSPEDLGAYFLLVSIASVGAMMATLGLPPTVVRLISEAIAQGRAGRARGLIRTAFAIVSISALVFGSLLAPVGGSTAATFFNSAMLADVMWLGGAWLAGLALMGLVGESFRGLHDYRMAGAMGGAGSAVLTLCALIPIFVSKGRVSLFLVTLLGTLAVAICALVGMIVLYRRTARLGAMSVVFPREMLAVGLPLLVTSLAIFVSTQADLWILGVFRDKEEVAMYGAAVRLVQLVMMPMLMMNAVLAPAISEQFSQGHIVRLERLLRGSAVITSLPALVALGFIFAAAGPLLGWAYGDYYRNGATALVLVSVGQVVNVLTGSAAVVLMMTGHQRESMIISVAAGAGLIVGVLLVVDSYGINGIAAVAGMTTALHGLASAAWVKRVTGMKTYCSIESVADIAAGLRRSLRGI
jgi:O-antigen/teichoic acid export membrane protein